MVAHHRVDAGIGHYLAAIITGDAAQFTYIVSILLMTVLSVVVLTMMGTWIERRPPTHSLLRRWLVGWVWFGLVTALGYGIILLGINK
ncbi:MAG: hypothetical protein EBS29_07270 [Chloroflexia bacterium]|nr:hypothetical protein [Chloroflexia bacterium]